MCWTFEVSVGFALFEAITTSFIAYRAIKSKDPYVRGQVYVLPLLFTIVLVETCEAFLWLDNSLISVTTPVEQDARPCSLYNQRITSILYLFVLPFQPLCYMIPCRRVGDPKNFLRFKAAEGTAIMMIVYYCYLYVYKTWLKNTTTTNDGIMDESSSSFRRDIQKSGYKIFMNSETCSYIGQYHHLYWTFDTSDPWIGPTGSSTLIPHGSSYFLIAFTVIYARPWKFCSAIFLTMGIIYFLEYHYYNASYESVSIWCWSGIVCNLYHLLQPYVFPPSADDYAHYQNNRPIAFQQKQQHNKKHDDNIEDEMEEESSSPKIIKGENESSSSLSSSTTSPQSVANFPGHHAEDEKISLLF